jgi:Surface lipoprotein assembly modifier
MLRFLRPPRVSPCAAILLASILGGTGMAWAATSDEVRTMVDGGQSANAYTQCATIDVEADPRADLWCGVAAVDVGRAGVGVLALERYNLRYPDDVRGRLELARAYFYANDDLNARREFDAIAKLDLPPAVRASVERYLDALLGREAQYKPRLRAFVEFGGGYDSNVNAGVAQADLTLPVLGPVTVADFGVKKGAGFATVAAGVNYDRPVAPGVVLHGSAWGNGNFYSRESDFDLANLGASIGASYLSGANTFSANYAYGEILLDGDNYRSVNGLGVEWRRQLTQQSQLWIAPQYAWIGYSGDNQVRDVGFGSLAVGYRQWWLTGWQPVFDLLVFGGDERSRRDRPDLASNPVGITAAINFSPLPQWSVTGAVSYIRSNYDGAIPLIDVTRHDNNFVVDAGIAYFFSRNWSTKLEYQYMRNDSNISLYEYARNVVALKLRYDYR